MCRSAIGSRRRRGGRSGRFVANLAAGWWIPFLGWSLLGQVARGDSPRLELSPRVAEVVARQRMWLESWQSLTLQVETTTLEAEGRYSSPRDVGTRGFFVWKCDRQGFFRQCRVLIDGRGACFSSHVDILTPDRSISANYPTRAPSALFPDSLTITRHRWPLSATMFEIVPLNGLLWFGRWFPVGVEAGYVVAERTPVERDGVACPRIQFSNPSGEPRASSEGTITCDPRHAFLPCVWETSFPERTVVDEFREVRPGLWIPWRGTHELGSLARDARWKSKWVVTACDVDQPLTEADFLVPVGPKTAINDRFHVVPDFETPNPKPPQSLWEQWMASEGRPGGKPRRAGLMATVLMALVALLAAIRLRAAGQSVAAPP